VTLSITARLSILWTSLSRAGIQGLQLIAFVVTARWLSPTEFGTFAIVTLVVTLAKLLNDFGLQAALVHEDDPSASRLATAFWLNAALGLAFSTLIALAAYPAQLLLDYPDLGKALAVAGISFGLSLIVVPAALLQRRLRLGQLGVIEFAANLAGTISAIGLAWLGFGVLSFSIGAVVTALLLTIALTATTRYVPTARPTAADVRALWSFSGSLLAFNAANYFFLNTDTMVLTAVGTPQQVGIYSRANSLFSAPVTHVGAVIGRVLFPILSLSRDDPSIFKDRWLRTTFASLGILFPIMITCSITSPYVIGILFEPLWHQMGSILSILSLAAPSRLLFTTLGTVYQATAHTRELLRVSLGWGVVYLVGVLAGASWGPIGVAWGVAIASNLGLYIPLLVGLRYMGMSVLNLISEFRIIFAAGMAQLLVVASIRLAGGLGSDVTSLLACLVLGTASYAATGWLLDRRFFGRLAGKAR
jgi:O-antigen/teichoic acid export membrane protein